MPPPGVPNFSTPDIALTQSLPNKLKMFIAKTGHFCSTAPMEEKPTLDSGTASDKHAINKEGIFEEWVTESGDRKDVINNIFTSFVENIFMPKDGGGAGNNLAHGYAFGDRLYEEVMEIIDRETEGSDFGRYLGAALHSLFTLKRLTNHADSVIVLDNSALLQIEICRSAAHPVPTFDQTNQLVFTVMAVSMQTL
ncbi:hypothetical protein BD769DRAFT_1384700 [Suillus cothurnatus]|nr:hypothetical protein BD769DRAFT_1384700 [Suillus cothurnatus]